MKLDEPIGLVASNVFNLIRNKSLGSYIHFLATPFVWRAYNTNDNENIVNHVKDEQVVVFKARPIAVKAAVLNKEYVNLDKKWIKTSFHNGVCEARMFKNLTLPSSADIGYGPGIYRNMYVDRGFDFATLKPDKLNRDGTYLFVSKFKGKLRDGIPCFDYEFYDNKFMYFGNIFQSRYENIRTNSESGLIMLPPHTYFEAKYVSTDVLELEAYEGTYGVSIELSNLAFIKSRKEIFVDGISFGGYSKFEYRVHLMPIKIEGDYYIYDLRLYKDCKGVFLHLKTYDEGEFKMEFFTC